MTIKRVKLFLGCTLICSFLLTAGGCGASKKAAASEDSSVQSGQSIAKDSTVSPAGGSSPEDSASSSTDREPSAADDAADGAAAPSADDGTASSANAAGKPAGGTDASDTTVEEIAPTDSMDSTESVDPTEIDDTAADGASEDTDLAEAQKAQSLNDASLVMSSLGEEGVVPDGIVVLDFGEEGEGVEKRVLVDLSQDFLDYLNTLGSSEEESTIKSVVAAYRDQFDAGAVEVLVEGQPFSTGHNSYSGFMQ